MIEFSNCVFVLSQLLDHLVLPFLQLHLKVVHIIIQCVDLRVELRHEGFTDLDAHLAHVHVEFALVLNTQLDFVLHLLFQLAHHLLQLLIDMHW